MTYLAFNGKHRQITRFARSRGEEYRYNPRLNTIEVLTEWHFDYADFFEFLVDSKTTEATHFILNK